ncbi:MAG: hypothetical protein AABX11_07070 [Nanoarchaeota archaeon]
MDNYSQLLERIAKAAKMSSEEVDRKVEAKRAKLSGLVSREGAAQIVAAELGINFDQEKMKISELVQGMKRANIVGKVLEISPVRSFNKNGREGKVVNLVMADESSSMKVVLWDSNHISLIENHVIKEGDVLEVSNGMVRNGELHLSSFSDIKQSNEKIENVASVNAVKSMKIKDVTNGQKVKSRAFIVQVFDPRYFEVCSECGKKVIDEECKVHGKVQAKKRALLTAVLDDGSETIRAVLFAEQIASLGIKDEELYSLEAFNFKKAELLGEEFEFFGNVRTNALYNTTELMIEKIEKIDSQVLINEFQGSK